MKANKCDCCGRYYDAKSSFNTRVVKIELPEFSSDNACIETIKFIGRTKNLEFIRDIDLCGVCCDALSQFFKDRRKDYDESTNIRHM